MKEAVTNKMRSYIKSIIVSGDVQLLIGGQFIIAPTAKVECAHSMVINVMHGGTLTSMRGGTLTEIKKWFDGVIGKITKPAKVLNDERTKP